MSQISASEKYSTALSSEINKTGRMKSARASTTWFELRYAIAGSMARAPRSWVRVIPPVKLRRTEKHAVPHSAR